MTAMAVEEAGPVTGTAEAKGMAAQAVLAVEPGGWSHRPETTDAPVAPLDASDTDVREFNP